jgi:sulfur carrier protein ThiS
MENTDTNTNTETINFNYQPSVTGRLSPKTVPAGTTIANVLEQNGTSTEGITVTMDGKTVTDYNIAIINESTVTINRNVSGAVA